jgi:hypothetical protein
MVPVAAIREIISTNLEDPELEAFGAMATHVCEGIWARRRKRPSNAVAAIVIRYLAAHFCALREPPILDEKLPEGVSARYDANNIYSASRTGLKATIWGQTAAALDPTGGLDDTSTDPKSQLYVLNGIAPVA